jgi:hypothetical protein
MPILTCVDCALTVNERPSAKLRPATYRCIACSDAARKPFTGYLPPGVAPVEPKAKEESKAKAGSKAKAKSKAS